MFQKSFTFQLIRVIKSFNNFFFFAIIRCSARDLDVPTVYLWQVCAVLST